MKKMLIWILVMITLVGVVNALDNRLVIINETCDGANASLWWTSGTIDFSQVKDPGVNDETICNINIPYGRISTLNAYTFPAGISDNFINLSWVFQNIPFNADSIGFGIFDNDTIANSTIGLAVGADNGGNLTIHLLGINASNDTFNLSLAPSQVFYRHGQLLMYQNGTIQFKLNGTQVFSMINTTWYGRPWYVIGESQDGRIYFTNLTLINEYQINPNVNLLFRDETNDSIIDYVNISINFVANDTFTANYTTENGTFNINMSSGNYEIRYQPYGYVERSYYITINDTPLDFNLTLYSLDNETGSYPIIITIYDETSNRLPGARLLALRYFPNETTSPYKLVAMKETNQNGEAALDLELFGPYYRFQVLYNGEVALRDGPTQIFRTSWDYFIGTQPRWFAEYREFLGINYFLVHNQATPSCDLEWTDSTGILSRACIDLIETKRSGFNYVCNNCSTSSSGTLSCVLPKTANVTYICQADFSTTEGETFTDILEIALNDYPSTFGKAGIFWAFIMVLVAGSIGIGAGAVAALLFVLGIGVIFIAFTGIVYIKWFAISSIFMLFMIIIAMMIRRRVIG